MSREVNLGQIVPNIQIGTTTTTNPGTQASVTNVGTALNPILNFSIPKGDPGVINLLIVNELPLVGSEDTLYFVPKTDTEESDMYDEYVWINNDWELVGTKQITVDLTNYYTKTEVNNLIPTKLSQLSDDSAHRLVSDTEKTTWNSKQSLLVSGTNIKTINNQSILGSGNITIEGGGSGTVDTAMSDSSTNAVQNKVIKGYVDDIVGDIGTIIDNINGEVIGG